MTELTFEHIKETLEAEAIKDADVLDLAKLFEDLHSNTYTNPQGYREWAGAGDEHAKVADPDCQPIFDKFVGNRAGLTPEAHAAAVCEFLSNGGEVERLDPGAQSGLVSKVQSKSILIANERDIRGQRT